MPIYSPTFSWNPPAASGVDLGLIRDANTANQGKGNLFRSLAGIVGDYNKAMDEDMVANIQNAVAMQYAQGKQEADVRKFLTSNYSDRDIGLAKVNDLIGKHQSLIDQRQNTERLKQQMADTQQQRDAMSIKAQIQKEYAELGPSGATVIYEKYAPKLKNNPYAMSSLMDVVGGGDFIPVSGDTPLTMDAINLNKAESIRRSSDILAKQLADQGIDTIKDPDGNIRAKTLNDVINDVIGRTNGDKGFDGVDKLQIESLLREQYEKLKEEFPGVSDEVLASAIGRNIDTRFILNPKRMLGSPIEANMDLARAFAKKHKNSVFKAEDFKVLNKNAAEITPLIESTRDAGRLYVSEEARIRNLYKIGKINEQQMQQMLRHNTRAYTSKTVPLLDILKRAELDNVRIKGSYVKEKQN